LSFTVLNRDELERDTGRTRLRRSDHSRHADRLRRAGALPPGPLPGPGRGSADLCPQELFHLLRRTSSRELIGWGIVTGFVVALSTDLLL